MALKLIRWLDSGVYIDVCNYFCMPGSDRSFSQILSPDNFSITGRKIFQNSAFDKQSDVGY